MNGESKTKATLDDAIRVLRDEPETAGRFSEEARNNILGSLEANAGIALGKPKRLFIPLKMLALTATATVMLAVTLMVWLPSDSGVTGSAIASTAVQVTKVGESVVFTLSNGGKEHRVARSVHPHDFEDAGSIVVSENRFTDRLDSGPDLVFYRID